VTDTIELINAQSSGYCSTSPIWRILLHRRVIEEAAPLALYISLWEPPELGRLHILWILIRTAATLPIDVNYISCEYLSAQPRLPDLNQKDALQHVCRIGKSWKGIPEVMSTCEGSCSIEWPSRPNRKWQSNKRVLLVSLRTSKNKILTDS